MERQEAVGQLGSRLSDEEYKVLLQFLARKPAEEALKPDELDALKNEVVNCLKNQGRNPAELIRQLIVLYQDESQGEVWRDYCVQHLGTLYKAAEGADREAARKLLFQATELRQSSIPGTALIAIANNSGTTEVPVSRYLKGFVRSEPFPSAIPSPATPIAPPPPSCSCRKSRAQMRFRLALRIHDVPYVHQPLRIFLFRPWFPPLR